MKAEKREACTNAEIHPSPLLPVLPPSPLDAWYRRPKGRFKVTAMPLTAEEHYRLIELVLERQAARRHPTPESLIWDCLDATVEIRSH